MADTAAENQSRMYEFEGPSVSDLHPGLFDRPIRPRIDPIAEGILLGDEPSVADTVRIEVLDFLHGLRQPDRQPSVLGALVLRDGQSPTEIQVRTGSDQSDLEKKLIALRRVGIIDFFDDHGIARYSVNSLA